MSSRTQAQPVWVDLAALFHPTDSTADSPADRSADCSADRAAVDGIVEGIDVSRPAPGGLTRWLRTSAGNWVGLIAVVVPITDGSTIKLADQLVPAHALRPR
jgi:hypothetical protein